MSLRESKGWDVTLEVANGDGVIARADSPIRRTGIQRAAFTTESGASYTAELAGKEHNGVSGRVELRVVAFAGPVADECFGIQQLLARADAAYAIGQAIAHGTNLDPKADAASAYQSSTNQYQAAVAQLNANEPSLLLAQSQHALAAVFDDRNWRECKSWAEQSGKTYAAVGDAYGSARVQAMQAAALIEIAVSPSSPETVSTLAHARNLLDSVASFHSKRGESYEQALALNNIGLAFYYQGLNAEAIHSYGRALPLFEQTGELVRQVGVLQNIALAEYELGRFSHAIARYAEVLSLITPDVSAITYIIALDNSALAHLASGDFDTALRQYSVALELARARQEPLGEARSLHGIGAVYNSLGDHEQALNFYGQALELSRTTLDGRGRTGLLRSIGNILREQGRADEALRMHQEALAIASSPSVVGGVRIQIAKDLASLGRSEQALEQLEVVLRTPTSDEMLTAHALLERSRLRTSSGGSADVETDLRRAVNTFRLYEAPAKEFEAWLLVAQLKRRRHESSEALAAVDKALALAEEVRLQSANPELRATLMQPLRPAFDLKVSMLAEQYFADAHNGRGEAANRVAMQALMTSEQARARALADLENLDSSADGASAEHAQQRYALYRELAARRSQLEIRLDRSGVKDARVTQLRQDIATLRRKLDQINAQIGAPSVTFARRSRLGIGPAAVDRSVVPRDAAIIEYWLGAHEALAWVLTREQLTLVRLSSSSEIDAAARAFHASLSTFGSTPLTERLQSGERLHRLIFQPVASLVEGKRTVLVAPDGALHYVPFAALRFVEKGAARFLVQSYDIAVIPSLALLFEQGESLARAPTKQMLLVADPVYAADDPRIAQATDTIPTSDHRPAPVKLAALRGEASATRFSRLPGSGREASSIASMLPKAKIDRLEGLAATRNAFLQAGLDHYRFIHIASHGIADSEIPQLSALILSTVDRQGRPDRRPRVCGRSRQHAIECRGRRSQRVRDGARQGRGRRGIDWPTVRVARAGSTVRCCVALAGAGSSSGRVDGQLLCIAVARRPLRCGGVKCGDALHAFGSTAGSRAMGSFCSSRASMTSATYRATHHQKLLGGPMATVNWHRKIWKITNETSATPVLRNAALSNEFWLSPLGAGGCFVVVSEPGAMTAAWEKRILFPRGTVPFTGGAFTLGAERLESLPDEEEHVLQLYVHTNLAGVKKITARLVVLDTETDHGLATGVPGDD